MTELVDLATLASLGQHFATLEDVAELRASLLVVQNDLSLIKNFLANQFGADLDAENDDEYEHQQSYPVQKRIRTNPVGQSKQAQVVRRFSDPKTQQTMQQQQRAQPPPLQRFTVISRPSNGGGSSVSNMQQNPNRFIRKFTTGNGNTATLGTRGGDGDQSKKFHRNFLSLGTVKKQGVSTSSNGGSSGGSRNETLRKLNQNPNIKVEAQIGASGSGMPPLKMATKIETYYEEDTEDYNEAEEATYNEEVDNYDEVIQMSAEAEETKFDVNAYENYVEDANEDYEGQEEDGVAYAENYEDDTEMIDPNEIHDSGSPSTAIPNTSTNRTLSNGSRVAATAKKADRRRVSVPVHFNASDANDDPDSVKNCKVCHEDVPAYSLFNHVISTHYNGEVPTCTICKKTFTYKQGLISHMRYHDAQKYDKACSYCGKRFIRRSDVVIHERRLHTGERPYLCPAPQCNQGFVRRYCLLTHIKTNHGEPYMSQVMAQSGRRKSS